MKKQKPKILIIVEGGIVQAVHTSTDADIIIIDHDNQHIEEENTKDCLLLPKAPDRISKNLYEIFTSAIDAQEIEIRDLLKRIKF